MMRTKDFIQKLADNTGVDFKIAKKVYTEVFEIIKAENKAGNSFEVWNFGIFKVSDRKERKGHNPKTGQDIVIPAYKLPTFKASKFFKNLVN